MPEQPSSGIIDAHLHVWDPELFDYGWLDGIPALNRPFGFAELEAGREADTQHPSHAVGGYVFVQADCSPEQSLAEVDWVSSLTETHPVAGIVAHAPIEDEAAVSGALESLRERPLVVGVRRLLQSEPLGFSRSDAFVAGARALVAADLTFDACVTEDQLDDVIALADAVPELRIVLDHLGKPDLTGLDVGTPDLPRWRTRIEALAERPNVSCKLSGLPAQTGTPDWRDAHLIEYLDAALSAFGAERCLFGSDWPASSQQTTYDRWLDLVVSWTAQFSETERDRILGGTAADVYRLTLPLR